MKYRYFILLVMNALAASCEDVIDVELPAGKQRLIVDALIRVDATQEFLGVMAKAIATNNFFEEIPVTSIESIILITTVTREDGLVLKTGASSLIVIGPGSGIYTLYPNFSTEERSGTSAVLQDKDVLFTRIIGQKGRKYAAQARYAPVATLIDVEQSTEIFFSEDETEVLLAFEENPEIDHFYIFDSDFGEISVSEDTYYDEQEFNFSYFYDKNLDSRQEVTVSILGADSTFYNYMNQLIDQSEAPQGPLQTPTAIVRRNVFDITDLNNQEVFDNVEQADVFPLGYFAIV